MRTIAHRLGLALLAVLAFAPPAGAAEVARIEGASLDASDERRSDFCVRIETSRENSGTCGRAPWRARRSTLVTVAGEERVVVGGAVPAAIARAEAELADGRRVAFDTVPGPGYRGRHAGRLRFFLAALPVSDPADDEGGGVVVLRFFDAAGALQGAETGSRIGRPVGRSQLLLRQRHRGSSVSVRAEVLRRLMPTPLQLDRLEDHSCLVVRTGSGGSSSGSVTLCREPGPSRPLLVLHPESGCGGLRTVVAGFVGDAVSAVRLRLGSGRVREVPARTLSGGHRYVVTAIPRGEAVRRADAVGAPAGLELAQPPSGLPCAGVEGTFGVGLDLAPEGPARPPDPADQVAAEAGGHRLLVRDAEADRLCVGVDRLLADGSDCRLPPAATEEVGAFGFWSSGVVSAMLPAEVARVRFPGGREVPTTTGGYTGRYAGAVRFLLAESDAESSQELRMLDAAGAVIGELPVFLADPLEPDAGPVRLAGGRGWRLTAARYGEGGTCIDLALPGDRHDCDWHAGADGAFAKVGCTPRVAVVYGALDRRTRSVRVLLRGGRTLRARVLRIPRRIGGGRAFALALPRRAQVRALRLDRRRFPFPVLPAARQCGYLLAAPFLGEQFGRVPR